MKVVEISLLSTWPHCSQILTGFLMLSEGGGYRVSIKNEEIQKHNPQNMAIVMAEYHGKRIIYDMMDGYQNPEGMKKLLDDCDYYFKRSYSTQKNQVLGFDEYNKKIYPLGMNYMVSCKGNPYSKESLKSMLFKLRGDKPNSYFTSDKFACPVIYKEGLTKVIFFTRLWDGENTINNTRIEVIRQLKKEFGGKFMGGIRDSELARRLAPDIIVSKRQTERGRYLRMVQDSDICIGSTGLHDSIGWKTAEYVVMGKAIVCEELKYEVPGGFSPEKNYIPFSDAEGCVNAVEKLVNDPEYMYQMKLNNLMYYYQYLMPDRMIKRTLEIVDGRKSNTVNGATLL